MNIGELLVLNSNRYPEKTAIVQGEKKLSYRELNNRVNRLAYHLMDMGVQKGDAVGFMLLNSAEFAEIYYATQKIGALAVPMSFRLVPREVKYILDNAKCKVFFYGAALAGQVEPVKSDLATVTQTICVGEAVPGETYSYDALTKEGNASEPEVVLHSQDRARIQFTGGTTGRPKGVVHTHRSTFMVCVSGLLAQRICDSSETMLNHVPMFHSAGLNLLNMCIAVGGKLVIVETFDPEQIMGIIQKEGATYLCLLPPVTYLRLMDLPEFKNFDTRSITKLLTAAGNLPAKVALKIFDAFPNATLLYGYGLTESGPTGTLHRISREMVESDPGKLKSVGPEMPFVELRVVDDNGNEVAPGEIGEAIFRSPMNMECFFEQPELTAETIIDGWVHSGDYVRKDPADGLVYYMDRKKDMIKSGGENVYAKDVELIILEHPAVENCAVIGLPDPKLDEAVTAVVKFHAGASATEEEIIEICKKNLASFKKPRRVIVVDEFPLDAIGKIRKFKLRERYSAELQ
jgi:acyl-CoA synthetase (AMP-forming)/AMP-acid ligase II